MELNEYCAPEGGVVSLPVRVTESPRMSGLKRVTV